MGFFDLFSSSDTATAGAADDSVPSIGGIQADITNVDNIVNGNADSSDWGAGIGAGVGAYFGDPQTGADIGRTALPILNKTVRPVFSSIWNSIAK